jgi:hypothetical protein
VTRPGISSLVATQTEASSSQAASTLRGGTGSSLHRRATYATLGPGVKTLATDASCHSSRGSRRVMVGVG